MLPGGIRFSTYQHPLAFYLSIHFPGPQNLPRGQNINERPSAVARIGSNFLGSFYNPSLGPQFSRDEKPD
jgi:hypothetical protein